MTYHAIPSIPCATAECPQLQVSRKTDLRFCHHYNVTSVKAFIKPDFWLSPN